MHIIEFEDKIIKPERLISSGNNFIVYKGVDQFKNEYSIKRPSWSIEGPIFTKENNTHFGTYSSHDLLTSAWYGHQKCQVDLNTFHQMMIKQTDYLKLCSDSYNLKTFGIQYDSENDPCIITKYVHGNELNLSTPSDINVLWKILPSLIRALIEYPHGDLKENHIIIHSDQNRFSILDPSVNIGGVFETNTNYYPIVPPLFEKPYEGFMNFSDQLAIGIMVYKAITGVHPFNNYILEPYWAREFGNGIGLYQPLEEFYPFMTIFPNWFSKESNLNDPEKEFNASLYITSVRKNLLARKEDDYNTFKYNMFNITPPHQLNNSISEVKSEFCMSLLQSYTPSEKYIKAVLSILN